MGGPGSRVDRSRSECMHGTVIDAARLLDRRQFLQLAAAATGIAMAGSAAGFNEMLAQDPPSELPGAANPVSAMAGALGHDLKRIFSFVQEEIRYEPYAGILRGARGTLLARSGNSADQALLLADLLRASSIPVRFVSGPLDASAVDTLMATTIMDAEAARQQVDQSLISDQDIATGITWDLPNGPIAPEQRAKLPDLAAFRASFAADVKAFGQVATGQFQSSVKTIMNALTAAGISLPGEVTRMPLLEQITHTWVQANDESSWLDLDPSFPQVEPGKPVAVPGASVGSLPDEQRYRVDFTVIAETLVGGALSREPILEVSAFADELAYANVLFTHLPADDIPDLNLIGGGSSDGTRYNALLVIGPDIHVGRRSISIGGGGGGGGGGMFGNALGGGGDDGGLVEEETSAEWLDVRVTIPGAESVVARRAIFDRIGQVMRDSGVVDTAAVPKAELVDLADGAGAQYLPCRSLRAFFVSGGPVNVKTLIEDVGLNGTLPLSLVPGGIDALGDLFRVALAKPMGCRPFSDSPNIAAWVIEAIPDGYAQGLDIWHRSFGTLGLNGSVPAAPPGMIAGVIPHVVERIALGDGSPVGQSSGESSVSVGAIFEAAASQGVPTRLFTASLPADVVYEPGPQALIRNALAAGLIVVIPERAIDLGGRPRLGWWLIDPATGATVDQRDDGGGATTGETTIVTSETSIRVAQALKVGWALATPAILAARNNPKLGELAGQLLSLVMQLEKLSG